MLPHLAARRAVDALAGPALIPLHQQTIALLDACQHLHAFKCVVARVAHVPFDLALLLRLVGVAGVDDKACVVGEGLVGRVELWLVKVRLQDAGFDTPTIRPTTSIATALVCPFEGCFPWGWCYLHQGSPVNRRSESLWVSGDTRNDRTFEAPRHQSRPGLFRSGLPSWPHAAMAFAPLVPRSVSGHL